MTDVGDSSLLRLLQLTSPALPLGAFAYSQGLEYAAAVGWVKDEASAIDWLTGILEGPLSHLDLPLLSRMHAGWKCGDVERVRKDSLLLLACRESRELEQEDSHLGHALARVLVGQGILPATLWTHAPEATLAALYALAAAEWHIPLRSALLGYIFAWAEAQVGALSRLLPLGQMAAQRVLSRIVAIAPPAAELSMALPDDDVGALAPSHAIASALHETQYCRLFRS